MFGEFSRIGTVFAAAALVAAMAMPSIAADYHGQNGNMFFHGMRGAPSGGYGSGGRNFDFRGRMPHQGMARSDFGRSGFGNDGYHRYDRGMTAQGNMPHRERGNRFDGNASNGRDDANHPHMLASRNLLMRRGSGVSVVERNQPDYDVVGNYSGSTDIYHANGGTYATGYGYDDGDGGDRGQSGQTMRPRSKVIDVARMHDACSNENGVCVIRP